MTAGLVIGGQFEALAQVADTLAASWRQLAERGLVDGSIAFAVLLVLWLPLRRRLSPRVVCALFLLPLVRVAFPFGVPLPEGLTTLAMAQFWTSAPAAMAREVAGVDLAAVAPQLLLELAPPPTWTLERALFAGWACGIAILSLRFARAQWRTHRAVRAAQPVALADFPLDLEALRRRAGVRRHVRWLFTAAVASPAAGGLLRPYVLLPIGFAERLTAPQLGFVLLHELAHIRRGDVAVALVQRLLQILWFFHPAVWFASWLIDQHRELACDQEAVARSGASRRVCGEAFLAVAEWVHGRTSLPTATLAMFDPNRVLRRRLMQILKDHPKSSRLLTATYLLFAAAVTLPAVKAADNDVDNAADVSLFEAQDQAQDAQREQLDDLKRALAELKKQQAALTKQLAELKRAEAVVGRAAKTSDAKPAREVRGHVLGTKGEGDGAFTIEVEGQDGQAIWKALRLEDIKSTDSEVVELDDVTDGKGGKARGAWVVRAGKPLKVEGAKAGEGERELRVFVESGDDDAKPAKGSKPGKTRRYTVHTGDDGDAQVQVLVEGKLIDADEHPIVFRVDGESEGKAESPKKSSLKKAQVKSVEGRDLTTPMRVEGLKLDLSPMKVVEGHKLLGLNNALKVDVDCDQCEDGKPANAAKKAKSTSGAKAKKVKKGADDADQCDDCEACDQCEVQVQGERIEGADKAAVRVKGEPIKVLRVKKAIGV